MSRCRRPGRTALRLQFADQIIKPNDRLTSFERLQIYNQQYWWRLLGQLWRRLPRAARGARRSANSIGSRSLISSTLARPPGTFGTSGASSNVFFASTPNGQHRTNALALDMARVEWARADAFDGPELPPIDPEQIAGVRARPPPASPAAVPHAARTCPSGGRSAPELKRSDVDAGAEQRRVDWPRSPPPPTHCSAEPSASASCHSSRRLFRLLQAARPGSLPPAAGIAGGRNPRGCLRCSFPRQQRSPRNLRGNVQAWFTTWTKFGWLCGLEVAHR